MVTKKSNAHLRTEKAMAEALRLVKSKRAFIDVRAPSTYEVVVVMSDPIPHIIGYFDLRDCIRKRAPLKGINKAIRKAIVPKRKK